MLTPISILVRGGFVIVLLAAWGCSGGSVQEPTNPQQADPGPPPGADHEPRRGVGHAILMWLPNRLFDVLDLVRARVRVGPGWTLSARATELIDVNMGAHTSLFVGLRGPRGEPRIPWPFGLENFGGVEISVLDGTQEQDRHGPRYGLAEVGLGFQLLIVGIDLGVDVFEAGDFVVGIVLFDPMHDDF